MNRRLDRVTAVVLAVLMPLGPLCVAALRAVFPTFSSGNASEVASAVAAAPGRQNATVWLGYAAVLLLVPGVIAAAGLTRQAAPRLTWWAVALLVPAYLSLGGLTAQDAMVWSGTDAGLKRSTVGALYDHSHPALIVAAGVFVVGHVVGTVLLGLALLRSRRVPALFGWLLTISQPLHFVAFVVLGVRPLDVVAWSLTAIGMAAAAWALLHRPETPSRPVPQAALAGAGL